MATLPPQSLYCESLLLYRRCSLEVMRHDHASACSRFQSFLQKAQDITRRGRAVFILEEVSVWNEGSKKFRISARRMLFALMEKQ